MGYLKSIVRLAHRDLRKCYYDFPTPVYDSYNYECSYNTFIVACESKSRADDFYRFYKINDVWNLIEVDSVDFEYCFPPMPMCEKCCSYINHLY